jgi:hypothetical protein
MAMELCVDLNDVFRAHNFIDSPIQHLTLCLTMQKTPFVRCNWSLRPEAKENPREYTARIRRTLNGVVAEYAVDTAECFAVSRHGKDVAFDEQKGVFNRTHGDVYPCPIAPGDNLADRVKAVPDTRPMSKPVAPKADTPSPDKEMKPVVHPVAWIRSTNRVVCLEPTHVFTSTRRMLRPDQENVIGFVVRLDCACGLGVILCDVTSDTGFTPSKAPPRRTSRPPWYHVPKKETKGVSNSFISFITDW